MSVDSPNNEREWYHKGRVDAISADGDFTKIARRTNNQVRQILDRPTNQNNEAYVEAYRFGVQERLARDAKHRDEGGYDQLIALAEIADLENSRLLREQRSRSDGIRAALRGRDPNDQYQFVYDPNYNPLKANARHKHDKKTNLRAPRYSPAHNDDRRSDLYHRGMIQWQTDGKITEENVRAGNTGGISYKSQNQKFNPKQRFSEGYMSGVMKEYMKLRGVKGGTADGTRATDMQARITALEADVASRDAQIQTLRNPPAQQNGRQAQNTQQQTQSPQSQTQNPPAQQAA